MKKTLFFILTIIIYINIHAQYVFIPDANFKNALIAEYIDTNGDGQIQNSEAENVYSLYIYQKNISDLTGIEAFTNLHILDCHNNPLGSLNISNNTSLTRLSCGGNQLSSLDISNNINLTHLNFDGNHLTSLDISNNINLRELSFENNWFTSLDVSNSPNLTLLNCYFNRLYSLDVSNCPNLIQLYCENNWITSLNVSNSTNLTTLNCRYNQLNNLDVSTNINLNNLYCYDNDLVSLDVSNNINLIQLKCNNNPNLTHINLKNGNNDGLTISGSYISNFHNLPNLETVCVDELNTSLTTFIENNVGHSINFADECTVNQIVGNVILDINNDGCSLADLPIPNLLLNSDNGATNYATITQSDGSFIMYTDDGDFTTSLTVNLPSYFTVSPNSYNNVFNGLGNIFTADFCVEPNQTIHDVNISIIPTNQAKPGFNATYQIVYKNVGTIQLNGNVTLAFDETRLNFANASETVDAQTSNTITFNYANLNPFETRTINLEFNVFAPPIVNIYDILNFTATINPIVSDFTTDDNVFSLNQTVIGSYDPNDITCLEGNQVLLADADKYLHYVIRFQNTGTTSAINTVVTNNLDANLDWSTLQLESLSHANRVVIKNGNEIEFIFENINLPDSTTDEPNSHGFIAYKIKPKNDIALGDIISNKADIFFDFNEAIETNTATTTIVNVLATNKNTLLDLSVYPIPTKNVLNIKSKTKIIRVEIYNKLGQLIIKNTTENKIDISNLTPGLYFVKVEDVNNNFGVKKVVKK